MLLNHADDLFISTKIFDSDSLKVNQEYFGKRSLDIALVVAAVLAVWPILAFISALIYLRDGGSVIYRHTRIGRSGEPFACLKFRTMVKDSDRILGQLLTSDPIARQEWESARKLRDDPRIIPGIGHLLRKTSLDELPQLLNILRGDMSFVGPRPVTASELERYGSAVNAYLSIRPGLTGPWQVSGRSNTSYEDRVRFDTAYAADNSMLKDLAIMVMTVPVVIAKRGAYVFVAAIVAPTLQAMSYVGQAV
jgi:lipopolysaccharide/colanic/teichoic acid biosynthesis glycosyltransferase